jgi:hypothetical protein
MKSPRPDVARSATDGISPFGAARVLHRRPEIVGPKGCSGQELAAGRGLPAASRAATTLRALAAEGVERHDLTVWDSLTVGLKSGDA